MAIKATELPNRMDVSGDHKSIGGDPILKAKHWPKRRIYVTGGLHYIQGNSAPFFSLCYSEQELRGNEFMDTCGGYAGEEVLKLFPSLRPLAKLHLSDWNGIPMHAHANGCHSAHGAFGGIGARYHAGNADTYGKPPTDCFQRWADHMRIERSDAIRILHTMYADAEKQTNSAGGVTHPGTIHMLEVLRANFDALHLQYVNEQLPRWEREADACVSEIGIEYYYGPRMNPNPKD